MKYLFIEKNLKKVITWYLLLVGAIFFSGMTSCGFNKKLNQKSSLRDYILTVDGKPTANLLKLLETLEVKHNGTLDDIVKNTQKKWLRRPLQENWQVDDVYAGKRKKILPLLDSIGLIKSIELKNKDYDYLLIMGAVLKVTRLRIAYLLKLWDQGVRFKKIIILTGQRPLEQNFESVATLYDYHNSQLPIRVDWRPSSQMPSTEADMIRMVWNQAMLPTEMQGKEVFVIESSMKINRDGFSIRPTTDDTILSWLELKPSAGTCLAVSNQPYCHYQDATLRKLLPAEFSVESVGYGVVDQENCNIAVILDSLARWLYQELAIIKASNQ